MKLNHFSLLSVIRTPKKAYPTHITCTIFPRGSEIYTKIFPFAPRHIILLPEYEKLSCTLLSNRQGYFSAKMKSYCFDVGHDINTSSSTEPPSQVTLGFGTLNVRIILVRRVEKNVTSITPPVHH